MSAIGIGAEAARPSSAPAQRRLGALTELALVLTTVLLVVLALRTFVVEPYVISGISMEPTFTDSERLLISKFAPRWESLGRGDIVIFDSPREPGKRLIKRVIGLPGEMVLIQDGVVFVNGRRIDEPYLDPATHDYSQMRAVHLETDEFFVLGDNRDRSNDSRMIGPIGKAAMIGKALVAFYPRIRLL